MNRFIPRTALGLSLSLIVLSGCAWYREVVDPCWPQRYNALALGSVNEANNAQAFNGHVLDQTVWNYHFQYDPRSGAPTDRLNAAGIEKLKEISRRRPAPDTRIFLATAQDLPGLADQPPEKILETRNKLNTDRTAAIQKFLASQAPGHSYLVEVHDPAEVYLPALELAGSLPPAAPRPVIGGYQKLQDNFQGVLPAESGTSSGGTGGLGGGGGGGGGSTGGSPPR
jgi:hypothetical protein